MSSVASFNYPSGLSSVLSDAEQIVGYPTSFLNFRFLLSDEFSHLALELRKLAGTGHPLLRTARALLSGDVHEPSNADLGVSLQTTRGLVMLLTAKAAGQSQPRQQQQLADGSEDECVDGLLRSQRQLAEITEVIHTAMLMHRDVVNICPTMDEAARPGLVRGNKLATLSGDYLLARASRGLASLGRPLVVELMSQAICDLVAAEFLPDAAPASGAVAVPDAWRHAAQLGVGSLLGHSCRSALILARHTPQRQQAAFRFGQALAMLQRLHKELHALSQAAPTCSADVDWPSVARLLATHGAGHDEQQLRTDAFAQGKALLAQLVASAEAELCSFPASDSRDALARLVRALGTHPSA